MEPFYERAVVEPVAFDDDAGTADLLVVPYDRETPVVEMQPERGLVAYREVFRPGSCERAVRGGAGRLTLTYNHSESFADRLGVAARLWDGDDGLHATVRLDPSRMESAREALTTSHGGISVAFVSLVPKAFTERDGSLVERRSVILRHIAAVAEPAYPDAKVLAVRNRAEDVETTAADEEWAAEVARREAVVAEALALVAARSRWDAFRA